MIDRLEEILKTCLFFLITLATEWKEKADQSIKDVASRCEMNIHRIDLKIWKLFIEMPMVIIYQSNLTQNE